ncbi:hypothetical protein [Niveibacterium terrae]|uniref:hypothetical protein n=1 Tax=Niveibacterium terrae TaxID=3373598 RepID=UPI003A8D241F
MNTPISMGRYCVSPMTEPNRHGGFAASVSIHSGQGSASTTRILRFTPTFSSPAAALRYASKQGLAWVSQH